MFVASQPQNFQQNQNEQQNQNNGSNNGNNPLLPPPGLTYHYGGMPTGAMPIGPDGVPRPMMHPMMHPGIVGEDGERMYPAMVDPYYMWHHGPGYENSQTSESAYSDRDSKGGKSESTDKDESKKDDMSKEEISKKDRNLPSTTPQEGEESKVTTNDQKKGDYQSFYPNANLNTYGAPGYFPVLMFPNYASHPGALNAAVAAHAANNNNSHPTMPSNPMVYGQLPTYGHYQAGANGYYPPGHMPYGMMPPHAQASLYGNHTNGNGNETPNSQNAKNRKPNSRRGSEAMVNMKGSYHSHYNPGMYPMQPYSYGSYPYNYGSDYHSLATGSSNAGTSSGAGSQRPSRSNDGSAYKDGKYYPTNYKRGSIYDCTFNPLKGNSREGKHGVNERDNKNVRSLGSNHSEGSLNATREPGQHKHKTNYTYNQNSRSSISHKSGLLGTHHHEIEKRHSNSREIHHSHNHHPINHNNRIVNRSNTSSSNQSGGNRSPHNTTPHQHAKSTSKQHSCGRSHSYGSDFSAGCSASQCHPNLHQTRSCSQESSHDSGLSHLKHSSATNSSPSGNSRTDSTSAQVDLPVCAHTRRSTNSSQKIDSLEHHDNLHNNHVVPVGHIIKNYGSNDGKIKSNDQCNLKDCECAFQKVCNSVYKPKCSKDHNMSHDSSGDKSIRRQNNGCCSHECEHVGPMFTNMRKFSNNQEFKKPDPELAKKLIELIEFYLSDEYLAKDKYLLRQIRCKSEGYISIKLMTSFKKVKKLTRDWRTVRFALLQTANLIVSPEGFRVKRASNLPESLRKPRLLSSVVSIRLNDTFSTVDSITQLFAKYGEISLVRILKPGKDIPSDLRNYATQVPDIGTTLCAVVDFEQSESALQAVRCLKDYLLEKGIRLALLGPRVRRTLYKQDRPAEDDSQSVASEATTEKTSRSVRSVKISRNKDGINEIVVEEVQEELDDLDIDLEMAEKTPLARSDGDTETDVTSVGNLEITISKGIPVVSKDKNNSYRNVLTQQMKSKPPVCNPRVDSSESNTSSNKTCDISVDSGNCESTGINSNDDDMKAITLNEDGIKSLTKAAKILREPEGPGSNPDKSGFNLKRSSIAI